MELIIVRHGETEFNKQHKVMGQRIDAPLDEIGLQQARETLSKIPNDFAVIYSSPLKRAAQTAKIIADFFYFLIQSERPLDSWKFSAPTT